jgi:hypothetical protein
MTENTTSYSLAVYCNNCDYRGKVEIPKGLPVEKQPCPNCEVVSLEKDYNSTL